MLALALMATLGGSLAALVIVIAVTLVPLTARVIRGEALLIRELQYVEAARSVGASSGRIVLRHVLPGVVPSLIVLAVLPGLAISLAVLGVNFLGDALRNSLDPRLRERSN